MLNAARIDRDDEYAGEENTLPAASVTLSPSIATPAVPVMTGTYFHSLDEKGRIIIPSRLRPALTEQFWLMLDEHDNIGIFTYHTGLDVFKHCEKLQAEFPEDDDIAEAVERTTSTAELVTAEGNWRVQISELLRFHASLDKDIVTVGALNHAVVWDKERWLDEQERLQDNKKVRKVQAEILRAAASGARRKAQNYEQAKAEEEETIATKRAAGDPHDYAGRGRELAPGRRALEKIASAGDGRRSDRILALSKLGR